MKDLIDALPSVPRRTLERDVEELVLAGKLKAFGEKKGRRYRAMLKRAKTHE
jgi:hypothetical protein